MGFRVYLDEFSRVVKLMSKGYLNPSVLILHEFKLEDCPEAFKIIIYFYS